LSLTNLAAVAGTLPRAWASTIVARIGGARLKVLRMDEAPYPDESHEEAEGLLVLDGELRLVLEGATVVVRPGEVFVVPPRTPHSVAAGSHGTLVLFDHEP
jgi:quercetin dioxygenase-like cupin family protein